MEGVIKINFLIDSGSVINIIILTTFQNLKKANNKLYLETTKTKVVPYGQSENGLRIKGVCYLTLETSSKFATDKLYVVNTKAKNLLTGFCAIALYLLSLNTQLKTQCEINLTTHERKYRNSCSKLNLPDFKTQEEDNIPKRLRKLVQTYRQSLFTRKIEKLKDTKIKLHINELIQPVAQAERRIPFSLRESVRA